MHLARVRGAEGFARVVAVKRLHPELAAEPESVTLFLDEARMAARIRHANVVSTLDVLRERDEIWIVMEYVRGEALSQLVKAGPLPVDIVLAIFEGVLSGLDAVHRATDEHDVPIALVHRDISPHNVLVGVDGVARITDFGIAKARTREAVTWDGTFKGKLAYAAPEQVRGFPATVRSDLYSTAVTMWEALAGRRMFVGENEAALLFNVLEVAPPLLSAIAPWLGTTFDPFFARALDADPAGRFEDAREMLATLEACGQKASTRAVSDWVEATAKEALRTRLELFRDFEAERIFVGVEQDRAARVDATVPDAAPAGMTHDPRPSGKWSASTRPSVKRRSTLGKVALTTSLTVVALGGLFGARPLLQRPKSPASVTAEAVDAASSAVAGGASPSVTSQPTAAAMVVAPVASRDPTVVAVSSASSSHVPVARSPARSVPPKPRRKPSCDPPYTVDENGDRHYLTECLR